MIGRLPNDQFIPGNPIDIQVLIAHLNFLGDIPPDDLKEIFAESMTPYTVPVRTKLFTQDTPVDYVYIVLEGNFQQARIEQVGGSGALRQRLERKVGPAAILGVQDFLFADSYRTTARALETGSVLAITTAALNRLIFRHPQVRARLAPLEIINRLRTMPLVGPQEGVALCFLAESVEPRGVAGGEDIYRSGDEQEHIFLIDRGQVLLEWDDGSDDWLGNGAMLGLAKNGATIDGSRIMTHRARAKSNVQLLAIPHAAYTSIVGQPPDGPGLEAMDLREDVLSRLLVFSSFKPDYDHHMTGFVSHYYFPYSHVVIQQGEESDSLWVLMPGSRAAISANDKDGVKLLTTPCDGPAYFAESALLGLIPQDSTIEAAAGSEWLRLHWRDFERLARLEKTNLREDLVVDLQRQEHVVQREQRERYAWLQPGELIIILSRRHWIAYLRKGVPAFIAFAVLMAGAIFVTFMPSFQWWMAIPLFFLAFIAFALFVWGTIDYFNDWVVVTNRRVVHQEKVLFINEWRKEAPLEQIQNVNFETNFIGRWLNFGTMVIQTASTSGTISFDYTTHFEELRRIINAQREQRQLHSKAQSKLAIHRMLEARLGQSIDVPSQVLKGEQVISSGASWNERRSNGTILPPEKGDRIIWRRHWMVLIPKVWLSILVLGIWFFLTLLALFPIEIVDPRFHTLLIVVGLVMTLGALARVLWVVVNWHNDTYEVTDDEIAHVEKLPFALAENRKSAGLGRLQNVEMRVPSPMHWLLNYGDVKCQTAAEEGDFIFDSVPDPRAVAEEIQTRMERYRRREESFAAHKRAEELPDWFEVYRSLDQEPV
ncbi:MAG: cyclic nucleotide-binding domain-containing protein [Caldilineaceae bacterium]|nr:cyclic nucleotide-binding domain-containing protein [Caldilineaceae bacterium]